jgi:hypothetical protein
MGVYSTRGLSAVEKLQYKLELNPYYPFTQIDDGLFEYVIRYQRFAGGFFTLLLGAVLLIILIFTDSADSGWFLLPVLMVIMSTFAVVQYRDARIYLVDNVHGVYSFSVGKKVVSEGELHHVYIRLRKRLHTSGRTYYYLVLNGYRFDQVFLSQATHELEELRELGRRLATTLHLNYFDEANTSTLHRIVHFPPDRHQKAVMKTQRRFEEMRAEQERARAAADSAAEAAGAGGGRGGHGDAGNAGMRHPAMLQRRSTLRPRIHSFSSQSLNLSQYSNDSGMSNSTRSILGSRPSQGAPALLVHSRRSGADSVDGRVSTAVDTGAPAPGASKVRGGPVSLNRSNTRERVWTPEHLKSQ